MTNEIINQAIEAHYGLLGWTEQTREAIREVAGEEGLELVQEISTFANDGDLWIYAESHNQAYQNVQDLLREKYPFLSAEAVQRIATSAAYGWK